MTNTLALPVIDPAARAAGLAQLKRDRAEAEQLLETVPHWTADVALAVGATLVDRLRTHDALQAERDRVVMPIHAAYKNASETYAADLKESKALCDALKAAVGAYELAQHRSKLVALETAQAAVLTGDADTLGSALAVVNAAPERAAGVGTKLVWRVKRYLETTAIDPDFLIPNEPKIEALAKAHKSQDPADPPFVRGVVFELAASVAVRRNVVQ